jgi:hypothetical protein
MLEILRRAFKRYANETNTPTQRVLDVEYKNLAPLYVNEEITICCKPLLDNEGPSNDDTRRRWSVWIEKRAGNDSMVAVRGTVMTVAPEDHVNKDADSEQPQFELDIDALGQGG